MPKESTNQLMPDLLTTISLNPWPGNCSSSRLQMFASHLTQALCVEDATDQRCFTGTEAKFGQYTHGVTLKNDIHVIKVIERYPRTMGYGSVKENPETIVIYEHDVTSPSGRMVKEVDYLSIQTHHALHQHFGFRYNQVNPIREYMPKGTVITQSPSISKEGNYRYGLEANVALMSIPQIIEDGIVISKSFAKRMKTTGIETYTVSWGKKRFPINLYGNEKEYKIFPGIGDTIREDGLLMALRGYNDDMAAVNMSKEALRRPDFKYDECTYAPAGAKIIDIKIHHDERLDGVIRGKSLNTPVGMSEQSKYYLSATKTFYSRVLAEYKKLLAARKDSLHISPKFHRLLVEAQAMTVEGQKKRMGRTYRMAPIDEWRVEFTIEYPLIPNNGFKLTGLNGDVLKLTGFTRV